MLKMVVKAEPQTLRWQKRVEVEHFVIRLNLTQTDRCSTQYVINKVNRGLWYRGLFGIPPDRLFFFFFTVR
jgi:hypothetical protein